MDQEVLLKNANKNKKAAKIVNQSIIIGYESENLATMVITPHNKHIEVTTYSEEVSSCNSSNLEINKLKKQVENNGNKIRAMRHKKNGVSSKEFKK